MRNFFSWAGMFLAAFLVVTLSVVAPSFAQDTDTTLNLGTLLAPWMEMLVAAAIALVLALAGWATSLLKQRTGIDLEQFRQTTLQTALENGAGLLLARAKRSADGVVIDVRHPAIRDAILYVNDAAPEAVAHWGLTPEQIAQKLIAKIGIAEAAPATEVTNVTNNG